MNISYTRGFSNLLIESQIFELFNSVGWESAQNPNKLIVAMRNASHLICAWDNTKLIGLIRSMDDDVWSANIDCFLVHKDYQSISVGKNLLLMLLDELNHIQYISVAPNDSRNNNLYKKFGFNEVAGSSLLQKINL